VILWIFQLVIQEQSFMFRILVLSVQILLMLSPLWFNFQKSYICLKFWNRSWTSEEKKKWIFKIPEILNQILI
jgi:hypothetical protein